MYNPRKTPLIINIIATEAENQLLLSVHKRIVPPKSKQATKRQIKIIYIYSDNVKIELSMSFQNLFCISFVHFVTFAGRRQNKLQPK